MSETITRTILQAEIMAPLHDVGKLHWRFVGPATNKGKNLTDAHTTEVWEAKDTPLRKVLATVLPDDWLTDIPGRKLSFLGTLAMGHHGKFKNYCEGGGAEIPHAISLIMYADTADSLFAKGDGKATAQASDIHLARPQGGVEASVTEASVNTDAQELEKKLTAWLGDGLHAWDMGTLRQKRKDVMAILCTLGTRHMAETRLPSNDVSLWQHSLSVASIFKALLAGCLHTGRWDHLLSSQQELAHAQQQLSLLAIRWDSRAWMARSLRSFEVVGRQQALQTLTDSIKTLVEEELALGNEIYRDHTGICFLVPRMPAILPPKTEALAATAPYSHKLHRLVEKVAALVNERPVHGDLAWQLYSHDMGLRLTGLLDFWHDHKSPLFSGPARPVWMDMWKDARSKQVCPRCGLRPIAMSHSRTGSNADNKCDICTRLSEQGAAFMRKRDIDADFWDMIAWEMSTVDRSSTVWGTRLALVQGVLDMEAVRSGELFNLLLTPSQEDWKTLRTQVATHRKKCCDARADDTESDCRTFFKELFGETAEDSESLFATAKDGWCSGIECSSGNAFIRARLESLVFSGAPTGTLDEQADAILTFARRQHPAPSRMGRMWDQASQLMKMPENLAQQLGVPMVPLTEDTASFQVLLPAKKALHFMRAMSQQYEKHFGSVRHMLPLHLSAAVFYYKAPLYIAMDAARRFQALAQGASELWTLASVEKSADKKYYTLQWTDPRGRSTSWHMPATLPNGQPDTYRGWFRGEDGTPMHLSAMQAGVRYTVRPSTFDFEVLDASTRRYDIFYDVQTRKGRPHFMMPHDGPRPYTLETLHAWEDVEKFWSVDAEKKSADEKSADTQRNTEKQRQRHVALEILARLHQDWHKERHSPVFRQHVKDVLLNTLKTDDARLLSTMLDGSFFDLCEWHDFIAR